MTAETPAETRTAPAAGEAAKENAAPRTTAKKIWTSAVFWSSLRACLFLAAAIFFFGHGNSLRPGSEPQLKLDEPTVTVLTNDPYFAGVGEHVPVRHPASDNQQYNLKLTITPTTHVTQDIQVEVSFGSVPQPIPSLKAGILRSAARGGYEYYTFLSPTVTPTGTQEYTDTYASAQQFGEDAQGGRLRVAFPTFTGEAPGSQFSAPACSTQGSLASGPDAAICSSLPAPRAAPPGISGPCRSCKPGRARSTPAVSASLITST